MEPKVDIIILNWNGWQDTIACLESIFQNDYKNYNIIVVDNFSTNDSVPRIKNWVAKEKQKITLLEVDNNLGFAGGNNVGIRFAQTHDNPDYIWLLNNDTVIMKDSLTKVVTKTEADKTIGICGSKLLYYQNPHQIQALGGMYNKYLGTSRFIINSEQLDHMDYVVGAAMLVSKEFLQTVGLLNEEYFLYYEEMDWAVRAKGKFKIGCAVDSVVYHKEGASIGGSNHNKNNKSYTADYYSIRSRLLFSKKYYPKYMPTVYLGLLITIFHRICRGQADRILMIFKLIFDKNELKGRKSMINCHTNNL